VRPNRLRIEDHADNRVNRAYDEYKDERASIEAQYNEAKEQVVQRLLASMEERRRKLREEKEGGEMISGQSLVFHTTRRMRTRADRNRRSH
jgi:hypothetical protein